MTAAIVVPEATARDEDVDRAVFVVVAQGAGPPPLATDRVGGAREAARAVIVEQAVRAGRARHEDVDAAIVVHIGERGVGTALNNSIRVRKQRERAVEV